MKEEIIALPVFQGRISPLIDEARKFDIVTIEDGSITERSIVEINEQSAFIRIERLKEIGVRVILCGAVSDMLAKFIIEREIILYSWLSGEVDGVIEQYIQGILPKTSMRYLPKEFADIHRCKRRRRGWKFHQRSDYNENSNTSTK